MDERERFLSEERAAFTTRSPHAVAAISTLQTASPLMMLLAGVGRSHIHFSRWVPKGQLIRIEPGEAWSFIGTLATLTQPGLYVHPETYTALVWRDHETWERFAATLRARTERRRG